MPRADKQAGPTKAEAQIEIANMVACVYSGYPEAAEDYTQAQARLELVRLRGWAEQEADALEAYSGASTRCKTYTEELGQLAKLVRRHLSELWPDLRVVGPRLRPWHDDPAFDWPAAEKELRKIEAAAVGCTQSQERAVLSTPDGPERTTAMTIQACSDRTGWSVATIRRRLQDLDVLVVAGGKYQFLQTDFDHLKETKAGQKRRTAKKS
ncbi:MAG: hypothetical protein ABIK89_12615 [Planctomycetota bacterium]